MFHQKVIVLMFLVIVSGVVLLFFPRGREMIEGTTAPHEEQYFNSAGNCYRVKLIDFKSVEGKQLVDELNQKTFLLDRDQKVLPGDLKEGHTFFTTPGGERCEYSINITRKAGTQFTVHIQGFKRDGETVRSILNAGAFNIDHLKRYHPESSRFQVLRDLVVKLTYK